MIEQTGLQMLQQRARQLRKRVIVLLAIVAAQIVALEVVLRGWQAGDAAAVFAGIGASALLCALAGTIFLYTRSGK
jgi:multidrug transporter EmrE-like cation transporter